MRIALAILLAVPACSDDPEPLGPTCGTPGMQVTLPYTGDLAGCGWYLGSIHVPDGIGDVLEPMRGLAGIDGGLSLFRSHDFEDLRELSRLEFVGEQFSIFLALDPFTSLDGLGSLREVGSLRLDSNRGLTSLRGLSRLEIVRGDLQIIDNPMLPQAEIDWLLSRVVVEGSIVTGSSN
jgi:hypothetical protein